MLNKLFKKDDGKTSDNLIKALEAPTFDESKVESLASQINLLEGDAQGLTLMHKMAAKNKIVAIEWLATKGAPLSFEDNSGETPLMLAAKSGYIEAIKLLIKLGAEPEYKNKHGRIAIQEAVRSGQIHSYLALKEHTKNLNHIDSEGRNILFDAVLSNNDKMVKEVLLNEDIDRTILDNEGSNIFSLQPGYSNQNIISELIKGGVDPLLKDGNGRNFLFHMLKGSLSNSEIFYDLIEDGADINITDNNGNSILIEAVRILIEDSEYKEKMEDISKFIHIICDEGIDTKIANKNGESALMLAIKQDDIDIIKILLNSGVDTDVLDNNKDTPLSLIAIKGRKYLEIINLLLDYGANPNIKDINGQTIIEKLIEAELHITNGKKIPTKLKRKLDLEEGLYYSVLQEVVVKADVNLKQLNSLNEPYFYEAAMSGNVDLVRLLVHYGADINQCDSEDLNILYKYMATNPDSNKTLELKKYYSNLKNLIHLGADVNARDSFGGITLHKAILDNDLQTIKILMASGADLNAIDNRGRHMLHNSMWKNKVKVFRLIYSTNKHLINVEDKFGVLPIHYAAFLGYTDLVLEIMDLGAHVNSPTKKAHYILNFLKRFHGNLSKLVSNARNPVNRNKLLVLVKNMQKEFEIEKLNVE